MPCVPSFKKSYILLDNSNKRPASILGAGAFYQDFSNKLTYELTLNKLFKTIKVPVRIS